MTSILSSAPIRRPVPTPTPCLTRPCAECENGYIYASADPSATRRECDECHGECEVTIACDGCGDAATEYLAGVPLCGGCAAKEREAALYVNEDVA